MYSDFFNRANRFYDKKLKKRRFYDYRDFLEESQWWSEEKMKEFQWSELRALLRHAASDVPYWRRFFRENGVSPADIKSYSDYCRLPVIEKTMIRPIASDFTAESFRGRTWHKSTGGSTGEPLHFEYTPESYDWRMAVSKRGYSWAGCSDGTKSAYIWGVSPSDASLPGRMKIAAHQAILRKKVYNCFDFTEEKMHQVLQDLKRFRPSGIIGFVNSLYDFTRFVERSGGAGFSPGAIIGAAEKLHDYQRHKMEDVFGCPVYDTYGCREFMLIASECEERRGLHVSAENLFVEILRDDGTPAGPGETGHVAVTDFHNSGMPFIRYKNGDMAAVSQRKCACGRGLPLIEGVAGRSSDIIRTPEGKAVSGLYFPRLLRRFEEIRKFQVIQKTLDSVSVKLVLDGELSPSKLSFIKNDMRRTLGETVKLNIERVESIPLTGSGKHRITISEVSG